MQKSVLAAGIAICAGFVGQASAADAVGEFYKGKQVEFIAAGEAGTTQDTWARIFARHLPKHLAGSPNFFVKNIPGSGHIKAADYLIHLAPKDGTTIGTFSNSIISGYVTKLPGFTFDTTKFLFLGSPLSSNRGCVAKAGVAVQKGEDLFSHDLIVGGTGATGGISSTPTLLSGLLGMRFKLVEGYPGPGQVFLAIERGELEGICNTTAGIETSRPGWLKEGKLKMLFNMEKEPLPGSDAPTIYKFTKTDEQRRIIAFYNSNLEIGQPYVAPPGTPTERVEALRAAFSAALKDPALIQDAEKAKLEINPIPGTVQAKRVQEMADTPADIIEKTNKLLSGGGTDHK